MIKGILNIFIECINGLLEFFHLPSIPKLSYIPDIKPLAYLGEKKGGRK